MEEDDKTILGNAAVALDSSNRALFNQQTIFPSNFTVQHWFRCQTTNLFLIWNLRPLCMIREKENKWKLYSISMRDHRVLTLPESLHTISYYSLADCFCQKHYTVEQQEGEMRSWTMHFSFTIHSRYSWGFFFSGLFSSTSQKVIFHLTTVPVLQSARWQINPVGLLWVLCRQMAWWCWWGMLMYRRLHRGVQGGSLSNAIWTVKCQGEMWGVDEPEPF